MTNTTTDKIEATLHAFRDIEGLTGGIEKVAPYRYAPMYRFEGRAAIVDGPDTWRGLDMHLEAVKSLIGHLI